MPFLLGSCVLSDRSPSLWWLSLGERGEMSLHNTSGVNCKKGETTDIKAQVPSIWAKGRMLDTCLCVI